MSGEVWLRLVFDPKPFCYHTPSRTVSQFVANTGVVGNNNLFSLLLTNLPPSSLCNSTRILVVYLHLNSRYNSSSDVTKMQDNGQAWADGVLIRKPFTWRPRKSRAFSQQ
jgi:hypothetical protein